MKRKTGARGLRSIMERALLETMYLLPTLDDVATVVVNKNVIENQVLPKFLRADGGEVVPSI